MIRGIPPVREYLVTLESGARYRVLAPTPYLARLNLQLGAGIWGPIRSIAAARRPIGQRVEVTQCDAR